MMLMDGSMPTASMLALPEMLQKAMEAHELYIVTTKQVNNPQAYCQIPFSECFLLWHAIL